MFNINGALKFRYIPNYKDMRGGYEKLVESFANSAIGALQDYVATLESKIKKLEGKDASNNRIRFAKRGDKVANPEPDKGKIKEQR